MEKLIKNALGQWNIIKEELRKAPVDPKVPATPIAQPAAAPTPEVASAPTPAAPLSPRDQNSQHLTGLFNQMKEHHVKEDLANVKALKGQIKDHILKAPKGSIDFGVLGDLRENQHKGVKLLAGSLTRRAIDHNDMAEIINHHLGDAKSIKDIHDNHGGMKAVETLMRTMGTNGDPVIYSNLKFKKPGLHEDLMDLVNPGKSEADRQDRRHEGVLPRTYLESTPANPKLHKKVQQTWESLYDDDGWDNPSKTKAHEDAVIARGLDKFKRHFKL